MPKLHCIQWNYFLLANGSKIVFFSFISSFLGSFLRFDQTDAYVCQYKEFNTKHSREVLEDFKIVSYGFDVTLWSDGFFAWTFFMWQEGEKNLWKE